MKIGLVIDQLRNAGGVYQLLHLAQELQKKGHNVFIYTLTNKIIDVESYLLNGLTIKSCNLNDPFELKSHSAIIGFLLYYFYLFRSTFLLTKLLWNEELDILNPHEWPLQWVGTTIKLKKKIPVVWMCNDVWHIPGQTTYNEERYLFRLGHKYFLQYIDKLLTHSIDKIVVLDHRIKKITSTFYNKDSVVVRSGIELNRYKNLPSKAQARKRLHLSSEKFIFLCLHSFYRHRRFEDVVLAFEQLVHEVKNKDLELYIVGSDKFSKSYADEIKKLVKEHKIEDKIIIRTNYLTRIELDDYLIASDTFIFPNNEQTWGIIVVEAMAVKKICIVSSGAGVHEIIEDGKNGYIFEKKDIKDLKNKMIMVLNSTNIRREKIGNYAREYVFNHLSWKNYAQSMFHIFKETAIKYIKYS